MDHRARQGDALIVIGPSGSGKSSVVRELHRRGTVVVRPTWTTRPPRAEEAAGTLEHRFVDDATFDGLLGAGFFAGTGVLPGLPYRYGLPAAGQRGAGAPVAVIGRAARRVKDLVSLLPGAVVYQVLDHPDRTGPRLETRGCPNWEVVARLGENRAEVAAGCRLARRTFDNDGTIAELADAIETALAPDLRPTERG